MFDTKDMSDSLKALCGVGELYEQYRVVNPVTHEVFEEKENGEFSKRVGEACYDIWGHGAPCVNCVSKHACGAKSNFIKLESLNERVLMVHTMPVMHNGESLSLELVRDITQSCVVSDDGGGGGAAAKLISSFNDLAVSDPVTGIFNRIYLLNEIDNVSHMSTIQNASIAYGYIKDYSAFDSSDNASGVLRHVAGVIGRTAKLYGGVAGRLARGEFALLFKDKDAAETKKICERITSMTLAQSFMFGTQSFRAELIFAVAPLDASLSAAQMMENLKNEI